MCNTFAVYFQIFATFGYKKVKNSDNIREHSIVPCVSVHQRPVSCTECQLRDLWYTGSTFAVQMAVCT